MRHGLNRCATNAAHHTMRSLRGPKKAFKNAVGTKFQFGPYLSKVIPVSIISQRNVYWPFLPQQKNLTKKLAVQMLIIIFFDKEMSIFIQEAAFCCFDSVLAFLVGKMDKFGYFWQQIIAASFHKENQDNILQVKAETQPKIKHQ